MLGVMSLSALERLIGGFMKIHKLILKLQELEEEHGSDINVRVFADHGQCSMDLDCCEVGYIHAEEYMAEEVHPDDLIEYPEAVKVVCVYG